MLVEFQQALADLTASPELCRAVRHNPLILLTRYRLTEKEFARLAFMANHKGMECSCMLYRANRLTPLAMNLPQLCRALGPQLCEVLSAYWSRYPNADAHFLLEAQRFCQYVQSELAAGRITQPEAAAALSNENELIETRLREITPAQAVQASNAT